jgi:hypothetical protein
MTVTYFIQDQRGYYTGKVFGVLCVVLMLFFGIGSLLEEPMARPLQIATTICVLSCFLFWFLFIDKRVWQVDLINGQTLRFRTSRTVDSISVTAVIRLVLTNVNYGHYRIKVIAAGRDWIWRSTEIDAKRFANAMLAINPQLLIDRRTITYSE